MGMSNRLQFLGIGERIIADRIEFRGCDKHRRQPGRVTLYGKGPRIAPVCFLREIPVIDHLHIGVGEHEVAAAKLAHRI